MQSNKVMGKRKTRRECLMRKAGRVVGGGKKKGEKIEGTQRKDKRSYAISHVSLTRGREKSLRMRNSLPSREHQKSSPRQGL